MLGDRRPTSSARRCATAIDERHKAILPPEVWGDGDPEGVRQRAAEGMKDTARAAAKLGVKQVNGFTGLVDLAPALLVPAERLRPRSSAATRTFAERWNPILDVFDAEGVRFGLEVHPTEIAYDFVTTERALDGDRPPRGVRLQLRPEPLRPADRRHRRRSSLEFADRIYHVHVKDSTRTLDGRRSILGSHLNFGEPRPRLGLRLARATATSTSRRSSAP